ncbi:MAG: hypothetical protein N3E50_07015 [Candidatus Goldbacteria bacterium]|nr:hypothetical protein [Candidatus Goldiibacteriota bacterium]
MILDQKTGKNFDLSPFYILILAVCVWFSGRKIDIIISIIVFLAWEYDNIKVIFWGISFHGMYLLKLYFL